MIAAKGPVTFLARIAGLGLVVVGLFWVALGLLAIVGGAWVQGLVNQIGPTTSNPDNAARVGNVFATGLAVIGIIWLVLAIVEILAGVGVMVGKGFGRVVGIIYSLVFGLILLPGLSALSRATPFSDTSTGDTVDVRPFFLIFVVMFIVYAYSLIVLLIRWRGPARA